MQSDNKIALVTGGAKRVGRSIVEKLAQNGYDVVINHHASDEQSQEVKQLVEQFGRRCLVVKADIQSPQAVHDMFLAIQQYFGRIDLLVNSASLYVSHSFPCDDFQPLYDSFGVAVYGSLYCANEAAKIMLPQGNGAIINIIDLFAFYPCKNMMFHGISKAALASLTQYLAVELGPTIRVNAIAPGPVLPPEQYSAERQIKSAERTLLKRWGKPEDVANAVLYLAEAEYVTGDIIFVDGGSHINIVEH
ncbi:SDR family NAD(P)-dependent oxidoreductase [Legionella shakespearei]|uniref:Pteridine reductase n=1 Tax=Legionella shakespearei DSM 23087 TaxID=1122169 RepID=A0A0W0Z7I0_9GAMM|nr:SDR family oxidoreductase [Legionella shakespearei]KTD65079.1 pteridine reductase [Legionella shakespearei DSM 23087]